MADLTLNEYSGMDSEEIKARLLQEHDIIISIDSSHDFTKPVINSCYESVKPTICRLNQLFSRQLVSLFYKKRFTS